MVIGLLIFTTYTFFGLITLLGLVAMIQSVPTLKWVVMRTSNLIDIAIFVFSIFATAQFGVTIAASLTIAGLGYTAFYKPYLNYLYEIEKRNKPVSKNRYIKF